MFCKHDFIKLNEKPLYDYFDYYGWHVGVFKCKCKKCGKVRNRKFLADRQLGEIL